MYFFDWEGVIGAYILFTPILSLDGAKPKEARKEVIESTVVIGAKRQGRGQTGPTLTVIWLIHTYWHSRNRDDFAMSKENHNVIFIWTTYPFAMNA